MKQIKNESIVKKLSETYSIELYDLVGKLAKIEDKESGPYGYIAGKIDTLERIISDLEVVN